VALAVAGFTWGGWVTGATATRRADARATEAVAAALVPLCLDRARLDPAAVLKRAGLQAAKSYERQALLEKTGWATPPGATAPDATLARACLPGLELAP